MLSTRQKILIVEDDEKIAKLLGDYLKDAGFGVLALDRGDNVVREVRRNPPDLIILDIILPGKDGLTICRELRTFTRIPILILSGKAEEVDRLLGLELGADDYMCKPFSPREVVARVRAILRRGPFEMADKKMTAGPITINLDSYGVTVGGRAINLTLIEFKLLKLLSARPFDVFTRNDILSSIWGNGSDDQSSQSRYIGGFEEKSSNTDYDRTIDAHIKNLRKKLENALPHSNLIKTVYGMGYTLKYDQVNENSSTMSG